MKTVRKTPWRLLACVAAVVVGWVPAVSAQEVFAGTKVVPFRWGGAVPKLGVEAERSARVTRVLKIGPFARNVPASDTPSAPAPAPRPSLPPATLRWNNGESVTGEPLAATRDSLTWRTPLFLDPLRLAWGALHRIDRPQPDAAPTGAFSFRLRDGSFLYGDLVGVTARAVTIHSERHGDVALHRAEVLSARRIRGGRLLYAGPLGESGWKPAPVVPNPMVDNAEPTAPAGNVPDRRTGAGGALVLPFWHRAVSLALTLPDRVDVEFRLRADERPAFQLALGAAGKDPLQVETWGDELVLVTADGFQKIRALDPAEREVALRLCWDRPARRCQVYTPAGALLTEWTVPGREAAPNASATHEETERVIIVNGRRRFVSRESSGGSPVAGLRLQNNSRELTLDSLRVRAWDGRPPAPADPARSRVECDDGSTVAGDIRGLEAGAVVVGAPGDGPPATVPLDAVDALVFADEAGTTPPPPGELARRFLPRWVLKAGEGTTLAYADGTLLRGHLAGLDADRATLDTGFTDAALTAKTDALRQISIREPNPAGTPAAPDKITWRDTTLHGRLVTAAGDASLHWLPVGGQETVRPSPTRASEITLAAAGSTPADTEAVSLFYTRSGDALPGQLHALSRDGVEFESPLVEARTLAAGEWQAVQFGVSGHGSIEGFDAPGWEVIKGPRAEVQKKGGVLSLKVGSQAAHPWAAQNGELAFTYDTSNFSFVRLRLFCDGMDPARCLSYVIYRSGNQVSTGVDTPDSQFENQNQRNFEGRTLTVRLVIDEKGLRCFVNNTLMDTVAYPAARRAGSGLVVEPTSMWGNQVREVQLSHFTASSQPGQSLPLTVNADAKAQTLTVPRFRRDDPPRHALLAANGDVLRGEVEAITNTQFGFRIGLETLHVPRERVTAVVALRPPSADAPPTADDGSAAVRKLLDRSIELRTWYSGAGFSTLMSVVTQAVPELKFKLPPDELDNRRMQYHFDNETVGATLDNLCEQFGMHWRIEKGAVVVERRGAGPGVEMARRVYWLKPGAPVPRAPAAEALAAKGVPFPAGAGAEWLDGGRSLEMTNTPANHEALLAVLARDFGGAAGSPTHWLILKNGARLGLTVARFGPDAIRGTHPVYGRCEVPLAEVSVVRDTPPEPTSASRAVGNWQLVYAPEPVLPAGGGEGSALLGKEAPAFKLAMLDGGEFDLAGERGKVVVLDFWATWCGPCVKSLPGLIETMSHFPADRVRLVGLNQAEAPEQVKRFLETRGWKLAVALDAGQNVARQYGVDGIPHTVIVGPDGKVAWVKTGYSPDGDAQAADAVKKLLAPGAQPSPSPAPAPAREVTQR